MNANTSPIGFYPNRPSQPFRASFRQKEIATICGNDLLPFYIQNVAEDAPETCELYEPNTNALVATLNCYPHLLTHTATVDGQSVKMWIYQGTQNGIFGNTSKGYFYLKIGNYYSDIFCIGDLPAEYTMLEWQIFDDIITVDGSLISKHVVYKQIFNVPIWHPTYSLEEEGKTNNGIYFAMQQTTKKTSGFSTLVNESQCDVLSLIAPIADNIKITTCINGQTRIFNTNRFEVKDKWQSDDVTHMECEFELFTIIRKYQKSETAPEPLPIPTPPEPPANYYIRGTVQSGTNSVQFRINGTNQTITCTNGEFSYGYNSALTSFETSIFNNVYVGLNNVDKILTLDLSESCLFKQATTVRLGQLANCTSINFGNCTFENAVTVDGFCESNPKLTSISIPEGTFASIDDNTLGMFADCINITSISLPKSVQANGAQALFSGCTKLETVNMPLATFANTHYAGAIFQNCTSLTTVTMTSATFANVTYMQYAFYGARGWYDAEMVEYACNFGTIFPACTAKPTTIASMFANAKFNSINLSALDMSACTDINSAFENSYLRGLTMTAAQFASVTNYRKAFKGCQYLNSTTTNLIDTITFAAATDCREMFANAGGGAADNITFTAGTFANVTTCESMFEGSKWKKILFKRNVADFSNCTDISKMFYNCALVNEIDMAIGAHFAQITDNAKMANAFGNCPALADLWTPQNQELYCSISLTQSPNLTFDAIQSICMWMADLTGVSPKILYLNSTAYNNLSAAEKNTLLTTYLQPKNWSIIA